MKYKMYGCDISIIPSSRPHAMHYEWLETGWASSHSGQPHNLALSFVS